MRFAGWNDGRRAAMRDGCGQSSVYWLLRLALGVLILATGAGKALDISGFVAVLHTYQLGLPDGALRIVGPGVAAIELALGVWILGGRQLPRAMLAAVILNTAYFLLLSSALWRGLDLPNCGCYGVYLAQPLRWYSPLEDLGLIALSLMLMRLSMRRRVQR